MAYTALTSSLITIQLCIKLFYSIADLLFYIDLQLESWAECEWFIHFQVSWRNTHNIHVEILILLLLNSYNVFLEQEWTLPGCSPHSVHSTHRLSSIHPYMYQLCLLEGTESCSVHHQGMQANHFHHLGQFGSITLVPSWCGKRASQNVCSNNIGRTRFKYSVITYCAYWIWSEFFITKRYA